MRAAHKVMDYCQIFARVSLILCFFILSSWSILPVQGAGKKGVSGAIALNIHPSIMVESIPNSGVHSAEISEFYQSESERHSDELPGKQIRFENLSVEHGLSQSSVSSILKDRKGFIWFGTQDGLNKYDGYGFTIYRHEPDNPTSISDNSIISLFEDENQVLWVGTAGRGLNRFDHDSQEFIHYRHDPNDPSSLANDKVTSIASDVDGNLWIGTELGLDRFDPETQQFSHYLHDPEDSSSVSSNSISDIALDREGTLWIGTSGGGLNRYDPEADAFIRYKHDPDDATKISSDYVTSISEDKSGNLWIGTGTGGLNFFDKDATEFFPYRYDAEARDPSGKNSITSVEPDLDGKIWIGTNGSGIEILDPTTGNFQRLIHDPEDPATLSSDVVTEILSDPSGNMWVGTSSEGVNRYDPVTARFTHFRHISSDADSIAANNVMSIAEDDEGNLWIGMWGGGLDYFDRTSGIMLHYQNDPEDPFSISSNDVLSVFIDQHDDIWVGTDGGGLNRYSRLTKRFTRYANDPLIQDSLNSDIVNVIFEDRDGLLWVGTDGGGLDRFDPITGEFFHFTSDPDDPTTLSNDQIWEIIEDRAGNLWIGTGGGGISVLNQNSGTFTQILHDPADPTTLGDTDILSIYEDPYGVMWIGTFGRGLDKYDPETGRFTHYRVGEGLPNNIVYGIIQDQQGYLWLSTNLGISRFDPVTESFKNFDAGDGLQSNEFNAGAYLVDQNGMLFFGGSNGISAFFPEEIQDSTYKPPVVYTRLMQDGEDILEDQSLENLDEVILSWRNNNLEFEFVALNFTKPENSQYAYKLEGFDDDWNYIGASRDGRYTNLPAGSYILKTKATNSDGIWNEDAASINVRVIPPFWETWWFIGLVTLVIMGSVISGYRLRIRSIESRSQELEKQVNLRTKEIEQRRVEMESLYQADEIIDQNLTQDGRLKSLVDVSIDLLQADNSTLLVWNEDQTVFNILFARGFNTSEVHNLSIDENDVNIWDQVRYGDLVIIQDLEKFVCDNKESNGLLKQFLSEGILSSIFLPIKFSNKLFGLFNVNYYQARSIGDSQIRVFKALTQHSAISIQNAQLFEQLRELAIDEERSRLARDLHDSAKQKAFAALAQLGAAGGMLERDLAASKEHILEAEDLVYEVLQELIILIQEMYPVALQEKGLANSVREFAYEWENQWDIEVELTIQNESQLSLEIEQSVYRVIQEAFANVARHSQADHVTLEMTYDVEFIQILIHDDGIGFNIDAQPTGIGLRSMKERIDLINGEIKIDSGADRGTTIRVIAPATNN